MTKAERAQYIDLRLNELYPRVRVPLVHKDAYTLLVAVLLSAQCTDERVNKTTPRLYAKAASPEAMINLLVKDIEAIIRPCGLAPTKAKAIWNLSRILMDKHDGNVPDNFEDLEALPGVGHKTASVIMAQAFGHPSFPVDTHIHRLAQRWQFTSGKNVVETERDLKKLFPRKRWNRLHIQIILYGREHCTARGCNGMQCEICKMLFPRRKTPVSTRKA